MSVDRRTHWGYHQLSDLWARRLVESAGIGPGQLVLDIGAGSGALTSRLVSSGARVVAVELHPARANVLRTRFQDQPVVVVEADGADLRLPRRPFSVVANPPFAVTTALLRRLLACGSRLRTAALVVPSHVGARWAGGRAPGAQRWSQAYRARVVGGLPSHAFVPPSRVATVVLHIECR